MMICSVPPSSARERRLDVVDLRPDGERHVGRQRPRRGRPREKARALLPHHGKADVDARVLRLFVAERDLVAGEHRRVGRAVPLDLVALVEQPFVVEPLQERPHRLDVAVVEGDVRTDRDPPSSPCGGSGRPTRPCSAAPSAGRRRCTSRCRTPPPGGAPRAPALSRLRSRPAGRACPIHPCGRRGSPSSSCSGRRGLSACARARGGCRGGRWPWAGLRRRRSAARPRARGGSAGTCRAPPTRRGRRPLRRRGGAVWARGTASSGGAIWAVGRERRRYRAWAAALVRCRLSLCSGGPHDRAHRRRRRESAGRRWRGQTGRLVRASCPRWRAGGPDASC